MLLFISGRHYVGGDYIAYLNLFNEAKVNDFGGFPRLQGLNYIIQFVHALNLNYFFFNFLCALAFLAGIFKFLYFDAKYRE